MNAVKWRMLKAGEVLRKGDEYQSVGNRCPGGMWAPIVGWGPLDPFNVGFYRRKVTGRKPAPKPRRESLTARIATAIQTGQNKPAMDTAREVMRILDNHNRAKRRKEGK